jgi:glycosyltransferase involved in cell wall biosynthesis
MQYRINPQYARWFDRPFWDVLMPLSAHRSRGIIAISDAAEKQILQYYPWSRGRTTVVTHGIDADFTSVAQRRDREPERDDLFLAVSTLHPHKNLDTLIRAFAPIEARHPTYRLVVCGLKGFETERLLALRDELGLTQAVAFTGWIPWAELLAYFVRAKAFVFPSKFEGFGIPVLEALTAGLPIVCSDIAPLREIAGDCATFFDPLDERALENALENAIASAPSSDRIAKSRTRAARFTWTASAIKLRSALLAAATRAAT